MGQLQHPIASTEFVRAQLQPLAMGRAVRGRNMPSLPRQQPPAQVPGGELPSKPSSQTLTQAHDSTVSFPTLGSPSEHEHPSWLKDSRYLGRHDSTAWECPMDTPVTPTAVSSRVPCYCLQRIHAL